MITRESFMDAINQVCANESTMYTYLKQSQFNLEVIISQLERKIWGTDELPTDIELARLSAKRDLARDILHNLNDVLSKVD